METKTDQCSCAKLPREIVETILAFGCSRTRAGVCSVSKQWHKAAIEISISLSAFPELYSQFDTDCISDYYNVIQTNMVITTIIANGEYHLLVRIAHSGYFNTLKGHSHISAAYKSGDMDIIQFVKSLQKKFDITAISAAFYGACEGGQMWAVSKLKSKHKKYANSYAHDLLKHRGVLAACRGGRFEVFDRLFSYHHFNNTEELVIDACTGGNVNIISRLHDQAIMYGGRMESHISLNTWLDGLEKAYICGRLDAVHLIIKYVTKHFPDVDLLDSDYTGGLCMIISAMMDTLK